MPRLNRVRSKAGSTLNEIGYISDHTRFITSGMASYRINTEAGDIIEAAAVGREGIVSLSGITERSELALWALVRDLTGIPAVRLDREMEEHAKFMVAVDLKSAY